MIFNLIDFNIIMLVLLVQNTINTKQINSYYQYVIIKGKG